VRRSSAVITLAVFAFAAFVGASWPDLVYRYDRWRHDTAEAEAAPVTTRQEIYSSLVRRLLRVSRSTDPDEVSRASSAAIRVLNTSPSSFPPFLGPILLIPREQELHLAHVVLGRAALLGNDVDNAECHLFASVSPVVSEPFRPHFYSPLPDMTLAHELLVRGRSTAVLRYLTACGLVWPLRLPNPLSQWQLQIKRGAIPDFDRWSAYSAPPNPGMQRTRCARR
jgi:hypothetical protein